ncbi:unnamed protein product [Didymodactylos carnosus]|uniref:Uncharacterized protein n=1 Tax=Didymodactylos carnosus TaxID=1234261 RepID=A0A8S2EAL4_9BILA|nr:unnamed protein product [Didymodactylos carnosus]CAF3895812.1 unnamed protein product [Didymodactylos carnosus]
MTQIHETLLLINDIIRIALLLNIDKTNNLTILPRLEVPMISLLSKSSTFCGNLIIVDTPGPNEDQLSKHLKQVIINELRKSAIILIALDFNSLNSTDEAEIKRDIEAVCNEVRDSTTEQIKAFISSRFKIQKQNIFEVSAKNALLSCIFLNEYKLIDKREDLIHDLLTEQMITYKTFIQQALGQYLVLFLLHQLNLMN